ncbi:hypothetical protein B0A50_00007 [Salinomyces thailandicus]|uniref:Uncharacterized protein n=1 Tax=Salinomyces thailandicus TaxID=706561 RepID=A0A4U0UFD0_9PEZI|nr:hypothetical protein B0A50_00007 [Salinomyces thailandica]
MGSASASGEKDSPFGSWSNRSTIMNLEQQAEEISQGGSDMGEEIRRMNEESKERSRQNSIQSSHQGDANGARGGAGGGLDRQESGRSRASSHAQSVVNVNGAARWGGYSPGGFYGSPAGSLHSGSWSHASMARKASASGASKLAQMVEPLQEGSPPDSPREARSISIYSNDNKPSRQPSQSSFARRYDQIAGQIEEQLGNIASIPPHDEQMEPPERPPSSSTFREAREAFKDFDGVHFNPDTEEFVELDADGNEIRRVSARTASGTLSMNPSSLLRTSRARLATHAEPPPEEGMIYYPAPVPRMLNLPKRLSQWPAANVQARRRDQMLNELPAGARQAAPWLSQTNLNDPKASNSDPPSQAHQGELPRPMLNERMNTRNPRNLPPHLRATMYFEHQPVQQQQDFEMSSGSAVATLDNILAASTYAPVSAFTDHPYAGDVRRTVYAPEKAAARRSTATLAPTVPSNAESPKKGKKKRHSSFGNLLRRSSSGDKLSEQLQDNGSRTSMLLDINDGGKKLQKRKSQMSLGDGIGKRSSSIGPIDDLDRQTQPVVTPRRELSEPDLTAGLTSQTQIGGEGEKHGRGVSGARSESEKDLSEDQVIADDSQEAGGDGDEEEGDPVYAQPTTLLAELQVRKANQKSRNRTAATDFPNGMHSTLLQLDAVEEIQRRKRKKTRVGLAWEDPSLNVEDNGSDDEVPLGMLFPGKNGLVAGMTKMGDGKDWDRSLGLMERRELEENEPLRSRRNRLQGLPHDHGSRPAFVPGASQWHLAGQPDANEEQKAEEDEADEHEDETLVQRMKRLRTKQQLDAALGDFAKETGSGALSSFTDDILGQFGGLSVKEEPAKKPKVAAPEQKPTTAGAPNEEETLGQRRARLQREREAAGDQPTHPQLKPSRSSTSLANLLTTNPIGTPRKPSSKTYEPAQGTLLHSSAQQQAKAKADITNTNKRASSYGLDKPFIDTSRPHTSSGPGADASGFLGHARPGAFAAKGGFASGMYNNGLGGVAINPPLQTSASTPFGMAGASSYFASAPFAGGGNAMQTTTQIPGLNAAAYQSLGAGPPPRTGLGSQGAVTGLGVGEEPLDTKRRDAIDRWRMSVAP